MLYCIVPNIIIIVDDDVQASSKTKEQKKTARTHTRTEQAFVGDKQIELALLYGRGEIFHIAFQWQSTATHIYRDPFSHKKPLE